MNNNIVGMETNMEQLLDKVFDASLFSLPLWEYLILQKYERGTDKWNLFEIVVDNVCTI